MLGEIGAMVKHSTSTMAMIGSTAFKGSTACAFCSEEYLKDGDECCEREDVEHSRQHVERGCQRDVLLVWRHEAPQYL